jgi:hypothetical protein
MEENKNNELKNENGAGRKTIPCISPRSQMFLYKQKCWNC